MTAAIPDNTLPAELIFDILERAGSSSPSSLPSMLPLSKVYLKYLLPKLYHTVYLENPRSLELFNETLQNSHRKAAYRRAIHKIYFSPAPIWRKRTTPPIMFPSLPFLEELSVPTIWTIWLPRPRNPLRRLVVYTGIINNNCPVLPQGNFESLTHLVLPTRTQFPWGESSPTQLPSLTHLAIPLHGILKPFIIDNQIGFLAFISRMYPSLRIIVLMPFYYDEYTYTSVSVSAIDRDEILTRLRVDIMDTRYVVMPYLLEGLTETWKNGEKQIWETAERLQSDSCESGYSYLC